MIANIVDKLVGYVSPASGIKRMRERLAYQYALENGDTIARSYEAARKDRLTKNWRTSNSSADLELDGDADVIRARARDLVRNNAYAKGVLRAVTRNTVGSGIRPQAKVQKPNGEFNEEFNTRLDALWEKWQRHADVTGKLSFYEIQQLAMSERWEAGELLIQFVEVKDDPLRPLPFALELIDADRLASEEWSVINRYRMTGNEIRRGVEIDQKGRPVAYWIYPYHPNDLNGTIWTTPKRYPAENFLHLFRPNRIGQTRGVSEFAPIVRWLKNLDRYMDNELTSSTIASCFSVAIKSLSAEADGGIAGASSDDGQDSDGNSFEYLEPGIVARLFPDEEVQVIDPSRRQSDAIAWLNLMQRAMGVGTGLSYERLTRDYSQTNYSSNRASDLEDRREFRSEQQWMIEHLCIPVWMKFMSYAVQYRDRHQFMPREVEYLRDYDNWTSHDWQPPGWEWVDPKKEVDAIVLALENDLTTLAEANRSRDGGDWRKRIKQRGLEKEYKSEVQPQTQITSDEPDNEEPETDGSEEEESTEDATTGEPVTA